MASSAAQTLSPDVQTHPPITKTETTTTTITTGTVTTIVTTTTTTTVIDTSTGTSDDKKKRPSDPEAETSSSKKSKSDNLSSKEAPLSKAISPTVAISGTKELSDGSSSSEKGQSITVKAEKNICVEDSDSDEEVEGLYEQGKILIVVESHTEGRTTTRSFLVRPDTTFQQVKRKSAELDGVCPHSRRLLWDGPLLHRIGDTPREAGMKVGRQYTMDQFCAQEGGYSMPYLATRGQRSVRPFQSHDIHKTLHNALGLVYCTRSSEN